MYGMSVIVEAFQLAEQWGVVPLGTRGLAGEPGEDVVIGNIEQRLEPGELVLVERIERRIRETAHQEVHFAYAAMPSTKTQPSPAYVTVRSHEILARSQPVSSVPRDALRRAGTPYIAAPARCVIVADAQGRNAPE